MTTGYEAAYYRHIKEIAEQQAALVKALERIAGALERQEGP